MLVRIILFFCFVASCYPVAAQFKRDVYSKRAGCKKPTVSVSLEKGIPSYESKSHSELNQLCGRGNLLGCTLSYYGCSYKVHLNKEGCKQLDFDCYPEDFSVYILDDYPEGTCEYNAIRKHENLHVSAIQNFPKKNVEDYLNQCINDEIQKKKIKDGEEIYFKCAEKTHNWMNRRKEEKNREIDGLKKYDPIYFSNCKNWKMHDWEIEAHLDMKD